MPDWEDRDIEQAEERDDSDVRLSNDGEHSRYWFFGPIGFAGIFIVVAVAVYLLFLRGGTKDILDQSNVDLQAGTSVPSNISEPGADISEVTSELEAIVLPPLSVSDDFVRALVRKLSSHPDLVSFLVTEQLVRNVVVVVANVAEGVSPAHVLQHLRPEERFEVVGHSGQFLINPESYRRYDTYVDAFVSVNSAGLVDVYQQVKPLIEEACQELGYGEQPFEDILSMAFAIILKTPVVRGGVVVETVSVNYTYSERWLEELEPAQKQLLRTGPNNVQRIQTKVREIASELGL